MFNEAFNHGTPPRFKSLASLARLYRNQVVYPLFLVSPSQNIVPPMRRNTIIQVIGYAASGAAFVGMLTGLPRVVVVAAYISVFISKGTGLGREVRTIGTETSTSIISRVLDASLHETAYITTIVAKAGTPENPYAHDKQYRGEHMSKGYRVLHIEVIYFTWVMGGTLSQSRIRSSSSTSNWL